MGQYTPLERERLIIWAAGFLDGEGSIGLKPSDGGKRVSICVQATQVDPEPLLRLQELWGGSLRVRSARTERDADYFHWFIWSSAVLKCCQEVQPFVTVKRKQVELAIQFASRPRGKYNDPDRRAENQAYRQLFAGLNQRGVSKSLEPVLLRAVS